MVKPNRRRPLVHAWGKYVVASEPAAHAAFQTFPLCAMFNLCLMQIMDCIAF